MRNGSWILQNPLFGGYAAVEAYLPSQKISIAVVTAFGKGSLTPQGDVANYALQLYWPYRRNRRSERPTADGVGRLAHTMPRFDRETESPGIW